MGGLRTLLSDAGRALVLAEAALWLIGAAGGTVPPGAVPVAALYLHVWLTLLDGGWTALRRVTWALLGLSWFGALVAGILGFVLPAGQLGFLVASRVASLPLVGEGLAGWMSNHADSLPAVAGALATVPFLADLLVATVIRFRRRPAWHAAALLAVVAVLVVAAPAGAPPPQQGAPDGLLTPANIVPPPYALPWFALLRCLPDKLLGLLLTAAAVLLPMLAPWMRAERFRGGAAGVVWPILCLALGADFVGLGWLGVQMPEEGVIAASRALAAGWFAFFLLAPPLVGRLVRRDA